MICNSHCDRISCVDKFHVNTKELHSPECITLILTLISCSESLTRTCPKIAVAIVGANNHLAHFVLCDPWFDYEFQFASAALFPSKLSKHWTLNSNSATTPCYICAHYKFLVPRFFKCIKELRKASIKSNLPITENVNEWLKLSIRLIDFFGKSAATSSNLSWFPHRILLQFLIQVMPFGGANTEINGGECHKVPNTEGLLSDHFSYTMENISMKQFVLCFPDVWIPDMHLRP